MHTPTAPMTAEPHGTDVEPARNRHAGALAVPVADYGMPRPYDGGPS